MAYVSTNIGVKVSWNQTLRPKGKKKKKKAVFIIIIFLFSFGHALFCMFL